MNENEDNIEDLFGERFSNDEAPVSPRVWANIEKTLPNGKGGGTWYTKKIVLLSLLGVLSFGSITWLIVKPSNKIDTNTFLSDKSTSAVEQNKLETNTETNNSTTTLNKDNVKHDLIQKKNNSQTQNSKGQIKNDKGHVISSSTNNSVVNGANSYKGILHDDTSGKKLIGKNNKATKNLLATTVANKPSESTFNSNSSVVNSSTHSSLKDNSTLDKNLTKGTITTAVKTSKNNSSDNDSVVSNSSKSGTLNTNSTVVNNSTESPVTNATQVVATSGKNPSNINNVKDSSTSGVLATSSIFVKDSVKSNNNNNNLTPTITPTTTLPNTSINNPANTNTLVKDSLTDFSKSAAIKKDSELSEIKVLADLKEEDKKSLKDQTSSDTKIDTTANLEKDGSFLVTNTAPLTTLDSLKKILADTTDSKIPDSTDTAEKKKKEKAVLRPRWSFDVLLTPMLTGAISKANDPVYDSIVDPKNKQDKNQLDFSVGGMLNYSILPRLTISSGIIYSRYSEKYKFESSQTIDKSYPDSTTFIVTPPDSNGQGGKDTTIYFINSDVETKKYSSTKIDRYTFLSIPITISYSILDKQKFAVSTTLGLKVNLLLNGITYIRNAANTALVEESSGYNKISISYMAAMGMEYKLNTKLSVLVQPAINFNMSSVFSKNSAISQKPYSYGLNVGLRYRF